jgi:hypothetical protein
MLLNSLFSNILNLRSSLNVSDQVSHPHKKTGNLTFQVPNLMSLFCCSGHTKVSGQVWVFFCEYFATKILFHGEELLAPRPIPKLEDHPLSAAHDCLLSIFAATLHIEGCSSIRNLKTHLAVVTGTKCHLLENNFTCTKNNVYYINKLYKKNHIVNKSNINYHYHLPPWIRSFDLFWHQHVAIFSWGVYDLFSLYVCS